MVDFEALEEERELVAASLWTRPLFESVGVFLLAAAVTLGGLWFTRAKSLQAFERQSRSAALHHGLALAAQLNAAARAGLPESGNTGNSDSLRAGKGFPSGITLGESLGAYAAIGGEVASAWVCRPMPEGEKGCRRILADGVPVASDGESPWPEAALSARPGQGVLLDGEPDIVTPPGEPYWATLALTATDGALPAGVLLLTGEQRGYRLATASLQRATRWGMGLALLVALVAAGGVFWGRRVHLRERLQGLMARYEIERRNRDLEVLAAQSDAGQDLARLGYWVYHPRDGEFEWSDGMFRLMGRDDTLPPLTFRDIQDTLLPEDQAEFLQPMQRCLAEGREHFRQQYRQPLRQGGFRHFEVSGVVVREAGDAPTRIYGVTQDVTDRVQAEAAMREAKTAAEKAAQAKSEFLATMSHEIRTPLNGVLGITQLLRDGSATPEQEEMLEILAQSGEHLLSLVNDILDYGKIESGRMELDAIDFDLERVARTVVETFRPRAEDKGVALGTHFHPGLPSRFKGDPGRIRQILYNVVGNAVKYTHEGFITLRLEPATPFPEGTEPAEAEGRGARILVEDSGIGMDRSHIARLFAPFLETDAGGTRRSGGTGLGLAISKLLVELMGGKLEVESQPGVGSTFCLTLPLAPGQAAPPPTADLGWIRGKTVWVVEDAPVARDVLERSLKEYGVKVLPLESAVQACRLLSDPGAERPDILLTDWRMPEMDGLELAAWIRKQEDFAAMPIFLVTSGAVRGDAQRAREAGCDGFLVKPVAGRVLAGALCLALSRPRIEQPALITQHLVSELGYDALESEGSETRAPTAAVAAPGPVQAEHGDWSPQEPLHVLVVEDNLVNQKVALRMLSRLGCRATLATDGLAGVEARFEAEPELILMDLMMPRADGFEATRAIRRREAEAELPPVPIIACSAGVTADEKARCFAAGMDDFLEKPVSFEALSALVAKGVAARHHPRHSGAGGVARVPQAPSNS